MNRKSVVSSPLVMLYDFVTVVVTMS